MKASMIADEEVYELVRRGVVMTSYVQDHFYEARKIPFKVTLAKLRQMVNKGRLYGCACGCRGDFSIPVKRVRC